MDVQYAILRAANHHLLRRAARFANRVIRFKNPRSVRSEGYDLYVQTLDRWASLWLRRLTNAEQYETKLWNDTIQPGMIVADVGANLGLYSIIASQRVGESGRVHSFEPHPDTYRLLQMNLDRNGASCVNAQCIAVSEAAGEVEFFVRPEHQGDHRIFRPDDTHGLQTMVVPSTTLDAALGDRARLDVVKFDVQGAEHLAWRGMRRIIQDNPQLVVFAEFFPEGLIQSGSSPEAFLNTVRADGFSVCNINDERDSVDPISNEELIAMCKKTRYTNLLLRKGEASCEHPGTGHVELAHSR